VGGGGGGAFVRRARRTKECWQEQLASWLQPPGTSSGQICRWHWYWESCACQDDVRDPQHGGYCYAQQ